MTDWQPIETAPKDGNPFLVWGIYGGTSIPCVCWKDGDTLRGGAVGIYGYNPSHWMPLPEPPK